MEVLSPHPSLVVSPHPMLAAAGRQIHYAAFLPGESIAEYLDRAGVKLGRQPWLLTVDGHPVPREWWGRVRPKPGSLITLRALVQKGGGGGGKNPLQTVLSIALMVYAPGVGDWLVGVGGFGPPTAAEMMMGKIVGGLVSVAGGMVISALTQPPQPQLSQVDGSYSTEQVSPTYALSGGSNRARPFEPLPLVLGKHIIYPDYGAKYYTEFEGEDQYLYQIFNFGIGTTTDLLLTEYRIGTTPIASYSDVEIFEAGSDGKLSQMPGNVDSTAGAALTAAAGWISRTSGAGSTALAVDVQGSLYRAGTTGLESLSVQIEGEYRLVGAGSWTAWFSETITSASRKPIRRTWRQTVAEGQYEVRLRRVTADETDARNTSDFSWAQLKSYQPDAADYTGQRRVGVRIKASGQLQGQLEQFNAVASRKVPTWTGAAWVTAETENPAWLYLWFARGGSISGRPAYGVGLADASIDIDGIKTWGAFCDANSLTFNAVFDSSRSRADILNTIARCGRASPSWATGKLGVVWDAADQPVVAVFGMGNIVAGSFKVNYVTEKLPDEIIVKYINPDNDWKQDEVRAVVPGFGEGYTPQNPKTIELFGCKYRDMAGREANLIAASQRYHRRRVQWEADFEGLVAQRGDVVQLSHDLVSWGSSGRLVAATDTTITLDRKVSYSAGSPYICIRHPDGSYHIRAVSSFTGEQDTLTLTTALTFTEGAVTYNCGTDPNGPVVDYTYVFDPQATPGRRVKIVGVPSIKNGGERLQFVAVDDDPDYYASEANPYTWTAPATRLIGVVPEILRVESAESLVIAAGAVVPKATVIWDVSPPYDGATVKWRLDAGAWSEPQTVIGRATEILLPYSGQLDVSIIPYGPSGTGAEAVHSVSVAGKTTPPADVSGLSLSMSGMQATLSFNPATDLDVIVGGWLWVRHAPVTTGATWDNASDMLLSVPGTATSATVPLLTGTYLARWVDSSGNMSLNAASVITTAASVVALNYVAGVEQAPAWSGTLTDLTLVAGELTLATDKTTGSYRSAAIDLGAVYSCRVSASVTFAGKDLNDLIDARTALIDTWADFDGAVIDDVGASVWMRTTPDDPAGSPTWTSWVPLLIASDTATRGVQFEMRVYTNSATHSLDVSGFSISIDVPDRMETGVDVSSGAGSYSVTFAKPFFTVPAIGITAQGMQSGDYIDLTAKSETGFSVGFKNSGGSYVSRTFDWIAKAY